MTDLNALIERYTRWLQNIGFDGGPESPPFMILGALRTLAEPDQAAEQRGADRAFEEAAEIAEDWGKPYIAGIIRQRIGGQ